MAKVFISYAHEDRAKTRALDEALTACGHVVWWDKGLSAGESFKDEIEQRIGWADAVVVIWTTISREKKWVRAEASLALADEKLVTVHFGEHTVPEGPLHTRHADDLTEWDLGKKAPQIDRLNARIAQLKAEKDKAALGQMLHPIAQHRTSLDLAINTALPGGLRVYRLLIGALLASIAIWVGLYAVLSTLGSAGGVDLFAFLRIFIALLAARACNQIIIASKGRYIDRFFDSSFAFFCLTALLLGILFSILMRFRTELGLAQMIDQAVSMSLIILVAIYGFRAFLLAFLALQRRVD